MRLGWAGAVIATTATMVAGAAVPAAASPPGFTAAPPHSATVTLVTGDVVTVTDGRVTAVRPAGGRETVPHATVRGRDGHLSVRPADAQRLIAAGRVDPTLFDVTALLAGTVHTPANGPATWRALLAGDGRLWPSGGPTGPPATRAPAESDEVTVTFVNTDGTPVAAPAAELVDMSTGATTALDAPHGTATARVAPGEYAMPVYFYTGTDRKTGVMGDVPVSVHAASQTVTVDARAAHRLTTVLDDDPKATLLWQNLDLNRTIGAVSVSWQTAVLPAELATLVLPARATGLVYRQHSTFTPGQADTDKNWQADTLDYRTGSYPADPVHHARLSRLARTSTVYRGTGGFGGPAILQLSPVLPDGSVLHVWRTYPQLGVPYTQYVENALPGLRWNREVGFYNAISGGASIFFGARTLPQGTHETYGDAAFGPRVTAGEAVRDRDVVTVNVAGPMSDASGHTGISAGAGTAILYEGARHLASVDLTGEGIALSARMPAPPVDYRLSVRQQRDRWPAAYSSAVDTDWTFRSGHTGAATDLPLNSLVIAPGDLDGANTAPLGGTTPLTVTPTGGPRVTGVTAQASTDDGKTWIPVALHRTGTRWSGRVTDPVTAPRFAAVSLRVTATNAAGGSVTQTVTRAYGLR